MDEDRHVHVAIPDAGIHHGGRSGGRLSRNVGQPDHILANPIIGDKAKARPGAGEIWLAVTKHDGVQIDSIFIDQAKVGQAPRQVRASNFNLPVALGLLQLPPTTRGPGGQTPYERLMAKMRPGTSPAS